MSLGARPSDGIEPMATSRDDESTVETERLWRWPLMVLRTGASMVLTSDNAPEDRSTFGNDLV
jgi:hypothetical protein